MTSGQRVYSKCCLRTAVKFTLPLCAILDAAAIATPNAGTHAGLWRTVDDRTGKPRGLVRIYQQDGALYGRIESSFDLAEAKGVCGKCPGEQHNQPVIGLIILRGLRKQGNEYSGGEILDPDTGWVYRCRLTLEDNGSRLVGRADIGVPMSGR